MADISKITLPNGSSYNFKDSTARNGLSDLGNLSAKSTNGSTTQFLRGDGTWATPPNTQYDVISTDWIDENLT